MLQVPQKLQRQLDRWYGLIPHPVQLDLVQAVPSGVRFPLVPAGRRSGKTERFKRFIVKQSDKEVGLYFAAAPTYNQAKRIFWQDLKDLSFSYLHTRKPSESELIIYMNNGSEIHVLGLDKPERFEGIPWTGGGIDEFANVKESAWESNIFPALNTVDPRNPQYRAWAWLFGVPEGLNHYYELCEAARANEGDFAVYHWKSSEILPADVIEAAKKSMSAKQYRQEFEASFETATGRIYEDYGPANFTDEAIKPHEQLYWSHDQNFTPLSSAIGVIRNDCLYLLDEIVLTSAISRQSAEEFAHKFKDHKNKQVMLYGDPAGRSGEKHGHKSDYSEIKQVLASAGWQVADKVKKKAPAIKDRQNIVRARILNAAGDVRLFVNPETAPWCHKGLSTVQLMEGSAFQEDQRNKYQHITTAIGYMADAIWGAQPVLLPNIRSAM